MFIKTLKHDLKNSYKDYMMLYITMLVFAVLAPLGAKSNIGLLNMVIGIMFMFIMVGSFVLMISNTIKFLKRRLFDEGAYFNLTLPVKIETTLLSKVVTVTIWIYVTILFVILSVVVLGLTFANFDLSIFREVQNVVVEMIRNADWLQVFFSLIFILVSSFVSAIMIILVMTLVNTSYFKKSNYFISILFFIAITVVKGWVDEAFNYLAIGRGSVATFISDTELATHFTLMKDPMTALVYILYELIWFGLLFMVVRYLFKRKLEI